MRRNREPLLVAIALFRLAKAIGLLILGLGILRLVHPDAAKALAVRFASLPIVTEHAALERAVAGITRLSPARIHELAVAAFAYGALFTVEGAGLLLGKQWAEWLTILATSSFVPFEVVETVHKVTAMRIAFVVVNVAIVIYLVWRRLKPRRRHR